MTTVSTILGRKGADVATIAADRTLADAAQELTQRNIGALVVRSPEAEVAGLISERDVVRHLATAGPDSLQEPVTTAMSADLVTCTPQTHIHELMELMTTHRIRHVPVLHAGRLAGIVSIGDVVKWRIDELQVEAGALQAYVAGSY